MASETGDDGRRCAERERVGREEMMMSTKEESMTGGTTETRLPGAATTDREGKYLSFFLDGEEYGIGILKIKEIIDESGNAGNLPVGSIEHAYNFFAVRYLE